MLGRFRSAPIAAPFAVLTVVLMGFIALSALLATAPARAVLPTDEIPTLAPLLKEISPAIVNISSVTSAIGRLKGASMYGATKAGLIAYTRYLAVELAPRGIRVNAVAPGYIAVPMSKSMNAVSGGEKKLIEQIPMRRLGGVDEIADVVDYLLSDRASYVTGATLFADGGVTAV